MTTSTTPPESTSSVVVVTNNAEAEAALGKLVRVTGTVQSEKPGDVVVGPDIDVLCPDHRFADELSGTEITIEGTMRKIQLPEATVDPETGAVSQGVAPGTPPRYAIDGCTQVDAD